ncbi:MAG: hypothetical protein HY235_08965 [Acidobacteria bacterium]|nr:hypothetical protein [Acidobacteriota bacterium]
MTQSKKMLLFVSLWLALLPPATPSQESTIQTQPAQPDEYKVYAQHPRLLVNPRRLRLLRREKERKSLRWEQFQLLMTGKVDMPEKGFAHALYYLASEDAAYGKIAVQWALGPANDLRQLALVFDWCQPLLTPGQSRLLAAKILKLMEAESRKDTVPAVRARVLAAIALADHTPEVPERTLRSIFEGWWIQRAVPAIKKNRGALALSDSCALMEILHAIRDNLNFDMRDNALTFFKDFPLHRVLSYYPATFPAAENLYRIPQYPGLGEPDLKEAVLSRAADLSIVAFDTNALEHQYLQGWLIQDPFLMRASFGIPYEFLWANPYQPGLSYHHLPMFFHDPKSGILILRSSWDDDATWLSYAGGEMELFMDGRRSGLKPSSIREPLQIGDALVLVGQSPMKWSLNLPEKTRYFLIGLKPESYYEIEVDDEGLREEKSDRGGILALTFPASVNVGVRLKESPYRRK